MSGGGLGTIRGLQSLGWGGGGGESRMGWKKVLMNYVMGLIALGSMIASLTVWH